MWTKINTSEDIAFLLEKVNYLVDSCVKEMRYISGSYSENGETLCATNSKRDLYILFHSISENYKTLEIKFSGIRKLILEPYTDEKESVIYDTSLVKKDNLFYWFDYSEADVSNFVPSGTVVVAEQISWRIIEDALGKEEFYLSKQ